LPGSFYLLNSLRSQQAVAFCMCMWLFYAVGVLALSCYEKQASVFYVQHMCEEFQIYGNAVQTLVNSLITEEIQAFSQWFCKAEIWLVYIFSSSSRHQRSQNRNKIKHTSTAKFQKIKLFLVLLQIWQVDKSLKNHEKTFIVSMSRL